MTTYLGPKHVTLSIDREKEMVTVNIAGVVEALMTLGEWSNLIARPVEKEKEKAILLR